MKPPVPVPLDVMPLLVSTVGFWEVLHTTPRAVTGAPPSEVMFPPLTAVVAVMLVTALVVNVITTSRVVKVSWLPYVVPTLLVA